MPPRPHLYIDFDGTISTEDTTDLLLERFALPAWTEVEAAWERGDIGSRDCMAQQVALLRATPAALSEFAAEIGIDPGFDAFIRMCGSRGLPFTILSDGLDFVARTVLSRRGIAAPILSNRLEHCGEDRWRLSFPYASPDCATAAGNCKCACLAAGQAREPRLSVLIGDGRSDFCGAGSADQVFAKGKLIAHCRDQEIAHVPFTDFDDLTPAFCDWLDRTFGLLDAAE